MIIGCVVYDIQLDWGCVVSGVVCLTSSGFSSGLLFSVGVFWPQVSILCVCVCVCVCALLGAFGVSTGDTKKIHYPMICLCRHRGGRR